MGQARRSIGSKIYRELQKFSATNEECKRLEKFGPHLD